MDDTHDAHDAAAFEARVAAHAARRGAWIRWERQRADAELLRSRTALGLARAAATRQRAELVRLQSAATRLGLLPAHLFGEPV